MTTPDEVKIIFEKIWAGTETDEDIKALCQAHESNERITLQVANQIVNIGQSKDFQIGHRTYQGHDAEAMQNAIRQVLSEDKLAFRSVSIEDRAIDLFAATERNAFRVRKALDPYILPTIRRASLLEKCLKQIHISIEGKYRVIPILGAAGYGKSTILGTIYDELHQELVQSGTGWVALARCDDLIESADNFAKELGEKVSECHLSIVEIAKQLTAKRSRGVLLLDTLDIVLTKPLVSVLRGILFQLLEIGVTIVFTCRDQDYSSFFEPYHESFAGFRESVYEGCKIPKFNDDEVREATREFVKLKIEYSTSESQTFFADKIIALSTDSVSLREIVQNPLLLALLCDIFAQSGNVPEDLTVSKLYETYWKLRIANVRGNLQSERLINVKEKLCFQIAETLYKKSGERLRDFIYKSDLDLNEAEFSAYKALNSQDILKDLGGNRIGFFHQTFLEYAIARWLNYTESGEFAKTQLREKIRANLADTTYYIWPIFRQLLTLIALSEFYQISDELDKNKILLFRSLAFAAVSRTEPESSSVLLRLIIIVNSNDYVFQEALLIAANSAPMLHSQTVLTVVIKLIKMVGQELINKAVEITAELLTRTNNNADIQFEFALEAIKNSDLMQSVKTIEERHHIWGAFINNYYKCLQSKGIAIELKTLSVLKRYYSLFGSRVRSVVIDLYLTPDVSESARSEFMLTIIKEPSANNSFLEKQCAILLLKHLLPNLLETRDTPFGSSCLEALHAPLSSDWMVVTATVVGDRAVSDPVLLEQIIISLFVKIPSAASKEFNRCSLIAVQEAINRGGGNLVASILLTIPICSVSENRISTLSMLLRTLVGDGRDKPRINPELQLALAEWVKPITSKHPVELIRAIDTLALNYTPVQQLLGKLLEALIPTLKQKQVNQIINKLTNIPEQLEPYLHKTAQYKESRAALLKLYQKRAEMEENNLPSAISELLEFCLDDSIDVAKDASWIILNFAKSHKPIDAMQLLPVLTKSTVVSVRQNCLKAFIEIVNTGSVIPSQILIVFQTLANETIPEILQLLYELVRAAIWNHPSGNRVIDLPIAEAAFRLIHSLIECEQQATVDMTASQAFITLNQLILLEDNRIIPHIAECSRSLLRKVDVRNKIDKSIITGLVNSLAKFDGELLEKIVREDFINHDKIMPIANQQALVVAIANNQGKNSPLLDEILIDPRFPEETKSRIRRERGV
jgi:Effector-associated domain 10